MASDSTITKTLNKSHETVPYGIENASTIYPVSAFVTHLIYFEGTNVPVDVKRITVSGSCELRDDTFKLGSGTWSKVHRDRTTRRVWEWRSASIQFHKCSKGSEPGFARFKPLIIEFSRQVVSWFFVYNSSQRLSRLSSLQLIPNL